jgi:hypothetical protein
VSEVWVTTDADGTPVGCGLVETEEREEASGVPGARVVRYVPAEQWIPVSERLPVLMDPILFINGRNVCQGYWDGNAAAREFCWHAMGGNVKMANGSVTHWMPLPAPPAWEPGK